MKKVVLFVCAFIFSLINFISCKNNAEGSNNGTSTYEQNNVNALFVINPTETKKKSGENWITINYTPEVSANILSVKTNAALQSNGNAEFMPSIEHTVPYSTWNSESYSSKKVMSDRAAGTTKRATTYKLLEKKTIIDSMSNRNSVAKMVYEGEYCYVWTYNDESAEATLSAEEIKVFAEKFDVIYEKEIALCGPKYDGNTVYDYAINPDKKISLMLCDIGQDAGRGTIYGYFQPGNYFDTNRMEIIFVDSFFAKREAASGELFSTVAHEFNHLLNYCNKELKYGLTQQSWYTEMLSMLCEDFFGEDLGLGDDDGVKQRLFYNFIKGSYIYGFGNWMSGGDHVSNNYANAYAFGAYLARNYGGAKLIHEIMTNKYVNEESVVKAVNKINGTSYSFKDLLKEFPLILINTKKQASDKPSLFKATEDELSGIEGYTYKLKEIDLGSVDDSSIVANIPEAADDRILDSYGFQFYYFSAPVKVTLSIKNFLNHRFVSF